MSDTPSDRRGDPRTELLLKVEYPSLDGFLQDYTGNISEGGTMLRSRRQLAVGDEVRLVMSFPGLLKPIHLRGSVRWVREDGGENAIGIEFDRDRASWGILDDLVQRIRSGDEQLVVPVTMRLLVVEDNQHVADLIRRGLEAYLRRESPQVAFEIDHAYDGVEALEALETKSYELVLVDVFLPRMDGETLVRRLRADERWAEMPIIALSSGDSRTCRALLAAGADFFLPKPLRLAELLDTMRKLVVALNPAPARGE